MSAPAAPCRKPRVSKTDWLDAGLRAISVQGLDGVRVERLASSLNVAKSGFYWHFKDRNDYLGQLLEHWDRVSTEAVLSDKRVTKGAPRQRLSRIMQLVEADDLGSYDIVLHAWAREDARARTVVGRVIQRREGFVGSILRDAGFSGEDLEMRTDLFVTYVSTEMSYFGFKSKSKRGRLRNRVLDLLFT